VPHLLSVVYQYSTSAERIGVLFSSYCFETVVHIEGGTEAKSAEEDIWAQEGCNRVAKAA
jgi:hypothetical protein